MTRAPNLHRRQFLRGAGGFALALPTLGSLLPRAARAQAMGQKRFVFIGSDHGGVYPENYYPSMPASAAERRLFAATAGTPEHRVRWGDLSRAIDGGRARLSNTLEAPSDLLTDGLLGKMNVVAGLDVSTYLGHNRAALLGNLAATDQGPSLPHLPTVDQLIAGHPAFAARPARERSLHYAMGYGRGSSLRHAMSAERVNGETVPVQAQQDPRLLWDRLFEGTAPTEPGRPLVVDRVLEHYRAVRTGAFGDAARMSASDRQRLDAHMERLFELQRKLSVRIDCTQPDRPDRSSDAHEELRQVIELFALALSCGSSHVGVLSIAGSRMSRDTGWTNWHEQVAHNGGGRRDRHDPRFQRINYRAQREIFEHAFLALASALDVDAGEGRTVLDDTLLVWTMESGDVTHMNISMPVVTAGSAGGWFHTGRFVDLRNHDNGVLRNADETPERWPGTLYNRFLSNILQSMGLDPTDWAGELQRVQPDAHARGVRGYGHHHYHASDFWQGRLELERDVWPEEHYRAGDDPIPGLSTLA